MWVLKQLDGGDLSCGLVVVVYVWIAVLCMFKASICG